jgi:hypothetical protein
MGDKQLLFGIHAYYYILLAMILKSALGSIVIHRILLKAKLK